MNYLQHKILTEPNPPGAQRLPLEKLQAWQSKAMGMFIHYGMATFDGEELFGGTAPSSTYNPTALDVDQWVCVARDAGMQYAVLTAKHTSGHCLWPSKHTDYHVGTSGNKTDVVEAFVTACHRRGVLPGLYYCSWDNHHLFGSQIPGMFLTDIWSPDWIPAFASSFTTPEYHAFQSAQVEELLTQYGPLFEVWIDIPSILPRGYRHELYRQMAALQPEAVLMMNSGFGDGADYNVEKSWPSDLIAIERFLPNSHFGHRPWRQIEGKSYYMPAEVCECIGRDWFYMDHDMPRTDRELLGMALVAKERNGNLLLNVPPNRKGIIDPRYVRSLEALRRNLDTLDSV